MKSRRKIYKKGKQYKKRKTKRRYRGGGKGILKNNNDKYQRKKVSLSPMSKAYYLNNPLNSNIIKEEATNFEKNNSDDDAKYWNNKLWARYLVKFIQNHPKGTFEKLNNYETQMYTFLSSKYSKSLMRKNSAAEKLYQLMKNHKENIFLHNNNNNNNPIIL